VTRFASLLVINDSDDPELPGYEQLGWGPGIQQIVGPPMRVGPLLNAAAPRYAAACDVIGFLGDDHRPRTQDWDEMLAAHLSGQPGVAYGDDLFQREKLPTACMISSVLVRTLGYMVPSGMTHLYLDDFWKLLGKEAGNLVYDPDVVLEHMHPSAGKSAMDAGYQANNAAALYAADWIIYQDFLEHRWPADAARLHEVMA
jgi:hypothetical protein